MKEKEAKKKRNCDLIGRGLLKYLVKMEYPYPDGNFFDPWEVKVLNQVLFVPKPVDHVPETKEAQKTVLDYEEIKEKITEFVHGAMEFQSDIRHEAELDLKEYRDIQSSERDPNGTLLFQAEDDLQDSLAKEASWEKGYRSWQLATTKPQFSHKLICEESEPEDQSPREPRPVQCHFTELQQDLNR